MASVQAVVSGTGGRNRRHPVQDTKFSEAWSPCVLQASSNNLFYFAIVYINTRSKFHGDSLPAFEKIRSADIFHIIIISQEK